VRTFTKDELTGWLQKNMGYSYFGATVMADFLFKSKQQWPQKSKKGKLSIHKRRKQLVSSKKEQTIKPQDVDFDPEGVSGKYKGQMPVSGVIVKKDENEVSIKWGYKDGGSIVESNVPKEALPFMYKTTPLGST
jgi:hypothetical protein